MDGGPKDLKTQPYPDYGLIPIRGMNSYKLLHLLGEGSYGKTFEALDEKDGKHYALKFEDKNKNNSLKNESFILKYLKNPGKIPYIKSYSTTENLNIIKMELLGKNLEALLVSRRPFVFSLRTVCNIAIQLIDTLNFIHDKHIIHRDLKPQNMAIGYGDNSKFIYIFDFGLAKKYRSSTTRKHFDRKKLEGIVGTIRFASVNAMLKYSQSRKDDLESLGYILIYFLKGNLPWQGLSVRSNQEQKAKILELKQKISSRELCNNLPKEFESYMDYVKGLSYESDPDYHYLKNLFWGLLSKNNYSFDYFYDWNNDLSSFNTNVFVKNRNNFSTTKLFIVNETNDVAAEFKRENEESCYVCTVI